MASHSAPPRKPEPFDLKPVEPRCSNCGYDLRTLANASGARCPECGASVPFDKLKFRRDRAAQRHFRRPRPVTDWWPVRWTWTEDTLVLLVLAVTTILFVRFVLDNWLSWFIWAGILLIEVVAAHVIIVLYRRQQLRKYNRAQREKSGAPTPRREAS